MDLIYVLSAAFVMGFIMFGVNTYAKKVLAKRKNKEVPEAKTITPVEHGYHRVIWNEPFAKAGTGIVSTREYIEDSVKAAKERRHKIPNPCCEVAMNGAKLDGLTLEEAWAASSVEKPNVTPEYLWSIRSSKPSSTVKLDDWFLLTEGTFKIRILPATIFGRVGLNDWFEVRRQHYINGMGVQVVPCNKTLDADGRGINQWGGKCAICDHHRNLWEAIGKQSHPIPQLDEYARKSKAVVRYYYNVIDRNAAYPVVKLMSVSPQVHDEIMRQTSSLGLRDITDIFSGSDITIEKKIHKGGGYPTFHTMVRNPSPLSDDKVKIENILANVWNLKSVIARGEKTNDEMIGLMEKADIGFSKDIRANVKIRNACSNCNNWFYAKPDHDQKYCSEECKELHLEKRLEKPLLTKEFGTSALLKEFGW